MAREFFKNLPDTSTPLTAQRLNGILNGEEAMGSIVVDDIRCKNLFNKNEAEIVVGYINNSTGLFTNNTETRSTIFKCEPLTTYTVSRKAGERFAVGGFSVYPEIGVSSNNFVSNHSAESLTITTSSTDIYLAIYFYSSSRDVLTEKEIFESIQIEKGSIATEYAPYKKYGYNSQESMGNIVVNDIRGKNLFNKYANNYTYYSNLIVTDEYIRAITTLTGTNYSTYVRIDLEMEKLLGKTVTLGGRYQSNRTVHGHMKLRFVDANNNVLGSDLLPDSGGLSNITKVTGTIPATIPDGATKLVLILYSNAGGASNAGDYVDYYDVMIEEGEIATTPAPFLTTIVESGKNDLGSWVKYSDGKMECSCIKNVGTVSSTQQWGSNFISNANIPLSNYPQTFIDEPVTTVSYSGNPDGDLASILVANKGTTTTPPICRLLTATSKTLYNVYVSYIAKGYWK